MRATGTFSPLLQQDRHAEIEITTEGGIAARIPRREIKALQSVGAD